MYLWPITRLRYCTAMQQQYTEKVRHSIQQLAYPHGAARPATAWVGPLPRMRVRNFTSILIGGNAAGMEALKLSAPRYRKAG